MLLKACLVTSCGKNIYCITRMHFNDYLIHNCLIPALNLFFFFKCTHFKIELSRENSKPVKLLARYLIVS